MSETTNDILEYPTPRDPAAPFLPSPELRALHDAGIAISRVKTWDGHTPWLVLSHAAQRQLLGDPRVSANVHLERFPHPTPAMAATLPGRPKTIFDTDGAEHARFRRMLTNSFTRNRMEKIRPAIQKVTDELIDKMLEGPKPTDLVTALALPLPSLMICELLGVPYADHDFFERHATIAVSRSSTPEQNHGSTQELGGYIARMIAEKMSRPEEDVFSDLGARVKAGELDLPEATMLGVILLIAGHETSANMITMGTTLLLQNPDQLALLKGTEDPQVVASTVEELLRYLTIPHLLQRRIAIEDIEIAGVTIRAGEGIIAPLPAANFDPVAFPSPEKVDVLREARHQHAFGWGPHQCIGQQLARIELQVAYPTIFRRIPTLQLAVPFESLRFKEDSLAYGIYELPVTW